ncbi:hypothetical protein BVRB_4g078710 [Beta vulgaris subsp. vulgaris]|nr:hypothetical protein BVRB_4g078710 [Beta vulgaris subsp. vulgaris]
MTSNVLTCSASTLVSNNKFKYSPLPVGLGPSSLVSTTPSLKSPSSRPSGRLVVKAQQEGSPNFLNPIEAEHFNKKVALLETSPYVRTPWNTSEDETEIRMWFDMPGLGADNIDVNIVDNLLIIKGDGGIDAFGSKISSPYDTRVQLPFNSWKEEITAVFKHGVLYIIVPKVIKFEHKVIHVPVRSIV